MGASTESASKRKKNGAGGLEGIASRTIVAPSLAEHKPGDGQDGAEIFGRCQRPSAPIVGISTSIRRTACLAGLTALGGQPGHSPHREGAAPGWPEIRASANICCGRVPRRRKLWLELRWRCAPLFPSRRRPIPLPAREDPGEAIPARAVSILRPHVPYPW